MTVSLLSLAAALWLCRGRRRASASSWHSQVRGRRRISDRWLLSLAGAAAIAIPVVCFGAAPGTAIALLTCPVVLLLVRHLHARDRRRVEQSMRRGVPLMLDLMAAVLRGGQPVPAAICAVAPVLDGPLGQQFVQVAGLLRLGADPRTAWQELADHPVLASVARTAARSAESGIRLADGLERVASEMREELRGVALARAHRAGVWAMAPLGLCFLPAFVCLGVIPVVVGIAHGVFPALPS
jgi:pilus assembly protein TadC